MVGVGAAVAAARVLADRPGLAVLGIVGAPGAGKTTLAERIVAELGDPACLLPMDGFHLANATLARLGRADRKGAPDTFDAAGYVATLRRIRAGGETVYAPRFHREVEESYAAELTVDPATTRLVVTEGNYLLLTEPPWSPVRGLLDACWYVTVDEALRRRRLVDRHRRYGRSPAAARAWAHGSDQRNADLIAATRPAADAVVRL
ncbi:nucleoside/nucleotide kinase family protein [Actinocatenispora thailandica]|uniref:nucleoside/nucleotide kinase family protein n=1 Tax=Actinocatenispora thailandica TaxID=227318 RepID=UPI003B837F43